MVIGERVTLASKVVRPFLVLFASACIALAPASAGAEPSAADKATARSLLDDGNKKFEAKDYDGALKAFRAARDIVKLPSTGYNVALAEEKLGLLLEARESALEVIGLPASSPKEPKAYEQLRAAAMELAGKLEKRIPSLVISVKGPADAAALRVLVDGKPVPLSTLGLPRKVNPGEHEVEASAPGHSKAVLRVTVKENESAPVVLTLEPEPPPGPSAPPAPPPTDAHPPPVPPPTVQRGGGVPVWAWVSGAGGLALIGVGAGFGVSALNLNREVVDKCGGDAAHCPVRVAQDIGRLAGERNVHRNAFIGLGVTGLAAVVVAVIGIATAPPKAPKPRAGFVLIPVGSPSGGGMGMSGQF